MADLVINFATIEAQASAAEATHVLVQLESAINESEFSSQVSCPLDASLSFDTSMLVSTYTHVVREREHRQVTWAEIRGPAAAHIQNNQEFTGAICGTTGCVSGWAVQESPLYRMRALALNEGFTFDPVRVSDNSVDNDWHVAGISALLGRYVNDEEFYLADVTDGHGYKVNSELGRVASWLFSGARSRVEVLSWLAWKIASKMGVSAFLAIRNEALQPAPIPQSIRYTQQDIDDAVHEVHVHVAEVARRYALAHDWCDVVEEALEEAGVRVPKSTEITHEVAVSVKLEVTGQITLSDYQLSKDPQIATIVFDEDGQMTSVRLFVDDNDPSDSYMLEEELSHIAVDRVHIDIDAG